MQLAARSYITAAAALAAGSMIAATPAMSSLPDIQAGAIQLTASDSILQPILDQELAFNSSLVTQELAGNANVLAGELNFESSIAPTFASFADYSSPTSILNGVVNRYINVANLFLSTGENTSNSLLGTSFDPVANNVAGLTGNPDLDFDSGQIGGLWGILDNKLFGDGDFIGLLNDQFGLSLPGPTAAMFGTLQTDELTASNALINGELTFNNTLLTHEVAAEVAAFGSNNALNGIIDRLINIDNLFLSTGENSFNSLLGADFDSALPAALSAPEAITTSLLTGSPSIVFDAGNIGGVEGIFDQSAALFADIAGLTPADLTGAFGASDPAAFSAALSGAIDPTAFSAFASDLTPVFTDLSTILMSFF